MALTFKKLKEAVDGGENPIVVLGENEKGELIILERHDSCGPHSVGRTMAKMKYDGNRHLIWITSVSAIRNSP